VVRVFCVPPEIGNQLKPAPLEGVEDSSHTFRVRSLVVMVRRWCARKRVPPANFLPPLCGV
jgi:hypothetical protein